MLEVAEESCMAIIICERSFPTALSVEDFGGSGAVLQPCLDVRGIRWLGSSLAADGRRSVCRFDAADAESVREANRAAGLPFECVWAATEFSPSGE
jgi:hypothetical protein